MLSRFYTLHSIKWDDYEWWINREGYDTHYSPKNIPSSDWRKKEKHHKSYFNTVGCTTTNLGSSDCELEVHSMAKFSTNKQTCILTRQHGSSSITSDLYSGGSSFESHLWHWLSWLGFSLVFLSLSSSKCQDSTLNLAMTTSFPIHYSLPSNYLMLIQTTDTIKWTT
jgi:hypothetical protein